MSVFLVTSTDDTLEKPEFHRRVQYVAASSGIKLKYMYRVTTLSDEPYRLENFKTKRTNSGDSF